MELIIHALHIQKFLVKIFKRRRILFTWAGV